MSLAYRRVLLKLSGEALAGSQGYGVSPEIIGAIAKDIREIVNAGVQVGIVVGGGNIFRGIAGTSAGIDRTAGDTIGMLATLMNSLMIKEALRTEGVDARVLSAFKVEKAAEFFIRDRAINHLNAGKVVIVAGGTGNPFFTTDTAAALRCAELECDVLFKATKVDGIYDKDPVKFADAVKLPELTHADALSRGLKIMDSTAFSLCMDNSIPVVVFKMLEPGNLMKAVKGEPIGSTVTKG